MTTERASSAEQNGEGEGNETGSPPRRVRYWQTPHVERIPAADASFLYMEHPVVHMHVTGVLLLDPSTMPGGYSFERLRDLIVERLHLLRPFRRRVLTVPFGIDHPVWVDDPDFDLDRHLHRTTLPEPGTIDQLAALVGEYASVQLDRSRPLWDMVVVEGMADGTVAIVSKVHHVAVDGASGTDLMAQLVDLSPEGPEEPPSAPPFRPDPLPNPVELAIDAVASRLSDPLRGLRSLGRSAGSVGRLLRTVVSGDDGPSMARPFDAPRTLFNRSLTARRAVAFDKAPLEDLKLVKQTFGTTVNDVFLAACTQSLRGYLLRRGERHERPLVVSVPVSVRGEVADSRATNQVSNMFVRLPVHLSDPVDQLRAIRADTRDAKEVHGAIGADMIGDVTELTPPAIFHLASRMYSRAGLGERLAPIHNLVISNVPGPPFPLYVAGARLVGVYPFGPLIEGSGLNITVLSNMGNMDIGVISCPDVVPDPGEVSTGIVEGIEVLRRAAVDELEARSPTATRPSPSASRRRGVVRTADTMPGRPRSGATTPAAKKAAKKKAPATSAAKKATAKKATAQAAPTAGPREEGA